MLPRIAAISFILICTSLAWVILAGNIEHRTNQSDDKLRPGVSSIWGTAQEQRPPSATYVQSGQVREARVPLAATHIDVTLALDYRRKGLLWYSTYVVDFDGIYTFTNPSPEPQVITYAFHFPAEHAIYDGLTMQVNGQPLPLASDQFGLYVAAPLAAQQTAQLRVSYRSHGLESWRYRLGDEVSQARNFTLVAHTNFKEIDFPLNALSPTQKHETARGWDLEWKYSNLISGFQIGVTMPEKLQPGPLAGQISYFAPVSLLLFFFLMFIVTTLRKIDLHPMNYFFLAAAFFAFHLLLAYLVDHISIHLALPLCAIVSVFLVVSYLRVVAGPRFAFVAAGGAQFIYLVLFSYAFFLPGFTGLSITIGCIVTLFVVMQLTAKIRWAQ